MMRTSDSIKSNAGLRSHDKQIYDTKHDEIVCWLYEKINRNNVFDIFGIKPSFNDIVWRYFEKTIEYPIYNYSAHGIPVVGFADICIDIQCEGTNITPTQSVENNDNDDNYIWLKRYIEIKSSINVGETIRQIRYYCSHSDLKINEWFVCAPPFAQSDILIEQGIGFIPYE